MEKAPEKRFGSAAEFAQALKPFGGGRGFTSMMPKGTAQQVLQVQEIPAAAQDLPVVPIEANKPSVPFRPPSSSLPKTVRMTPGQDGGPSEGPPNPPGKGGDAVAHAAAPVLPVTTPEGKVPVEALAAAAAELAKKRRAQPTALMLMGIAAGCLLAGIVFTMLILRLIGPPG
jgi:serine/threonine-protein kinase